MNCVANPTHAIGIKSEISDGKQKCPISLEGNAEVTSSSSAQAWMFIYDCHDHQSHTNRTRWLYATALYLYSAGKQFQSRQYSGPSSGLSRSLIASVVSDEFLSYTPRSLPFPILSSSTQDVI